MVVSSMDGIIEVAGESRIALSVEIYITPGRGVRGCWVALCLCKLDDWEKFIMQIPHVREGRI